MGARRALPPARPPRPPSHRSPPAPLHTPLLPHSVVAVIAEGVPERDTKTLIAAAAAGGKVLIGAWRQGRGRRGGKGRGGRPLCCALACVCCARERV